MGRPKGSKNLWTREAQEKAAALAKRYKDPLLQLFELRDYHMALRQEQIEKSTRHRNREKLNFHEDRAIKLNEMILPYRHARLQAIQQQTTTEHKISVIRAPEPIASSQAWLEAHKPKQIDATPVMDRFKHALKQSYDAADAAGIDDAQAIIDEAKKAN